MEGQETESFDPCQAIRRLVHELAQPLAAVTGLVDLLLLQLDKDDARLQEIQLISGQLQRVLDMIEEIRRITQEACEAESRSLAQKLTH